MKYKDIRISEIIAPSFYELHKHVKNNDYTHYMLKGGRGSTKSSFVSIEIPLGMMKDPKANAVIFMKTRDSIRESVLEQIEWGIDILGVSDQWKTQYSPMSITYIPTGQKIIFRGVDNPKKVKAVKLKKGYFKYLWFEEFDMFGGMEEIRIVNQTFMRGGDIFNVFYTYNPPKSSRSWVNAEAKVFREDRLIHTSNYRDVSPEWLGKGFITEAEHLKKVNENAYNHEYLGEEVGTGLEIFNNVTIRQIPDEEYNRFAKFNKGIDWGYAIDPAIYLDMTYDKTRRKLYIHTEIAGIGLSNRVLSAKIKDTGYRNGLIIADSAEPKSIDDCRNYGLNITGARKGKGSVEHGIKWLADLEEIIIDSTRCPTGAREFVSYCLDVNNQGIIVSKYPDKDNHTIDTTRYALEREMPNRSRGVVRVRR